QDGLNIGIRIAAPDKSFGQVIGSLGMVQPFNVVAFPEGILPVVTGAQRLPGFFGQGVIAVETDVATYTQVFDADQLRDIVIMVEHMLDGRRFVFLHEEPYSGYSYHAAGR